MTRNLDRLPPSVRAAVVSNTMAARLADAIRGRWPMTAAVLDADRVRTLRFERRVEFLELAFAAEIARREARDLARVQAITEAA